VKAPGFGSQSAVETSTRVLPLVSKPNEYNSIARVLFSLVLQPQQWWGGAVWGARPLEYTLYSLQGPC